jgi:hypothetical protein
VPKPLRLKRGKFAKFIDKSDPRVYDINNYDSNSFEIRDFHKCSGKELDVYPKNIKPLKCKLVNIVSRLGHPSFHFEIDGKYYFYGLRGVRKDYTLGLVCTYRPEKGKPTCNNFATISPSEFLKKIIQSTPKNPKGPKFLDRSDPKVYDIQNYDINSFDIGKGHKCLGTEIDEYNKRSKRESQIHGKSKMQTC